MMARNFEEEDEHYLHDEIEQVEDEFSDDSSSGSEELQIFKRKGKKKGRRSSFPDAIIDDMVDIIKYEKKCELEVL